MAKLYEEDIRRRFGLDDACCESCHEDLDQGIPCSTIIVDGQEVDVCCGVARAFKELQSRVIPSEAGGQPAVYRTTQHFRGSSRGL